MKLQPWQVIELLAKEVRGRYPVPSGVIGQLILEVGFGIRTPKDVTTGQESYNLGNIKGIGPAGSVIIYTTEYYTQAEVDRCKAAGNLVRVIGHSPNGKIKVTVKDRFRAYHNYGEAIDDHYALLKKPRYVNAGLWKATTPLEYATALHKAGYATDPNYVTLIMKIVDKYQLRRFDTPDPVIPTVQVVFKNKTFNSKLMDAVTWTPVRPIAEAARKSVGWTGTAATVNGKQIQTRVMDGVSYAPVRELARMLNLNVSLDGKTVILEEPK